MCDNSLYTTYRRGGGGCVDGELLIFLYKMRHILWVVALRRACDVTNICCHLGFYQELEIRLKMREIVIFLCLG